MTNKTETYRKIENFAYTMRKNIIEISYTSNTSTHVGGALSMTDLMATLYAHVLKIFPDNPHHKDRDRFILSKGHGVLGYFPALLSAGIISNDVFNTFQQNGSDLIAHPVMNMDLGIESSNGSLGQGLEEIFINNTKISFSLIAQPEYLGPICFIVSLVILTLFLKKKFKK